MAAVRSPRPSAANIKSGALFRRIRRRGHVQPKRFDRKAILLILGRSGSTGDGRVRMVGGIERFYDSCAGQAIMATRRPFSLSPAPPLASLVAAINAKGGPGGRKYREGNDPADHRSAQSGKTARDARRA